MLTLNRVNELDSEKLMRSTQALVLTISLSWLVLAPFCDCPILAKSKPVVDTSELSPVRSAAVQKAARLAKSGKSDSARNLLASTLASASDLSTCMAIASAADIVGFKLQDIKRQALQKAFSLCKTRDDYFCCALKARQLQVFDITSSAVKQLLASATSNEELLDLARRAQEIAMNDISHLALEKAYAQTKDVPGALALAKQSRLLGADDLARKICREVIDGSVSTRELIDILPMLEEFKYPDANRYLLKRALNFAKTVDDLKLVFDDAHRLNQSDIENLAGFRGRQMLQMQEAAGAEAALKQSQAAKSNEQNTDAAKNGTSGF